MQANREFPVSEPFSSVEDALEDLRQGRMVVVCDDEGRYLRSKAQRLGHALGHAVASAYGSSPGGACGPSAGSLATWPTQTLGATLTAQP